MIDQELLDLIRQTRCGDLNARNALIRQARRVGNLSLIPEDLLWAWKTEKNLQDLQQGVLPEPDFRAYRYGSDGMTIENGERIIELHERYYFPNHYGALLKWEKNVNPAVMEVVAFGYYYAPERPANRTLQYDTERWWTDYTCIFNLPNQPDSFSIDTSTDFGTQRIYVDPLELIACLQSIAKLPPVPEHRLMWYSAQMFKNTNAAFAEKAWNLTQG